MKLKQKQKKSHMNKKERFRYKLLKNFWILPEICRNRPLPIRRRSHFWTPRLGSISGCRRRTGCTAWPGTWAASSSSSFWSRPRSSKMAEFQLPPPSRQFRWSPRPFLFFKYNNDEVIFNTRESGVFSCKNFKNKIFCSFSNFEIFFTKEIRSNRPKVKKNLINNSWLLIVGKNK